VLKRFALCAIAACSSTDHSLSIEGGPLVAITEGETRTLSMSAPAQLAGAPSWASMPDPSQLVLAPDCSVIPGTDGAPGRFSLQLQPMDGSKPLDVDIEVAPSGAGACGQKIVGCVMNGPCLPSSSPPGCGAAAIDAGSKLTVDFPGGTNRIVVLDLINPDSGDSAVDAHVTTDAPTKFYEVQNIDTRRFCASAPDTGIVGNFEVDYSIARGPMAPVLAGGVFPLSWDTAKEVGVEVAGCAVNTGSCMVPTGSDHTVVVTGSPADVTLQLRLWTALAPNGATSIPGKLCAAFTQGSTTTQIDLTSSTHVARMTACPDPSALDFVWDQPDDPAVVFADIKTGAGTLTFSVMTAGGMGDFTFTILDM